nr:hypothetical protein Iba_chr10bCG2110 [Ipomoea batatas]
MNSSCQEKSNGSCSAVLMSEYLAESTKLKPSISVTIENTVNMLCLKEFIFRHKLSSPFNLTNKQSKEIPFPLFGYQGLGNGNSPQVPPGLGVSIKTKDENDVNRGRPSIYFGRAATAKTLPPTKCVCPNKVVNMFTIHGPFGQMTAHGIAHNYLQGVGGVSSKAKIDPQLRNQLRRYGPNLEQRIDELFLGQ